VLSHATRQAGRLPPRLVAAQIGLAVRRSSHFSARDQTPEIEAPIDGSRPTSRTITPPQPTCLPEIRSTQDNKISAGAQWPFVRRKYGDRSAFVQRCRGFQPGVVCLRPGNARSSRHRDIVLTLCVVRRTARGAGTRPRIEVRLTGAGAVAWAQHTAQKPVVDRRAPLGTMTDAQASDAITRSSQNQRREPRSRICPPASVHAVETKPRESAEVCNSSTAATMRSRSARREASTRAPEVERVIDKDATCAAPAPNRLKAKVKAAWSRPQNKIKSPLPE